MNMLFIFLCVNINLLTIPIKGQNELQRNIVIQDALKNDHNSIIGFCQEDDYLVTLNDYQISLWDLKSRKIVNNFKINEMNNIIQYITILGYNDIIVIDNFLNIYIYNLFSSKIIDKHILKGYSRHRHFSLSENGKLIGYTEQNKIVIYSLIKRQIVYSEQFDANLYCIDYDKFNHQFIIGTDEGEILEINSLDYHLNNKKISSKEIWSTYALNKSLLMVANKEELFLYNKSSDFFEDSTGISFRAYDTIFDFSFDLKYFAVINNQYSGSFRVFGKKESDYFRDSSDVETVDFKFSNCSYIGALMKPDKIEVWDIKLKKKLYEMKGFTKKINSFYPYYNKLYFNGEIKLGKASGTLHTLSFIDFCNFELNPSFYVYKGADLISGIKIIVNKNKLLFRSPHDYKTNSKGIIKTIDLNNGKIKYIILDNRKIKGFSNGFKTNLVDSNTYISYNDSRFILWRDIGDTIIKDVDYSKIKETIADEFGLAVSRNKTFIAYISKDELIRDGESISKDKINIFSIKNKNTFCFPLDQYFDNTVYRNIFVEYYEDPFMVFCDNDDLLFYNNNMINRYSIKMNKNIIKYGPFNRECSQLHVFNFGIYSYLLFQNDNEINILDLESNTILYKLIGPYSIIKDIKIGDRFIYGLTREGSLLLWSKNQFNERKNTNKIRLNELSIFLTKGKNRELLNNSLERFDDYTKNHIFKNYLREQDPSNGIIIIDSSNFFVSSKDGYDAVAFRVGNRAYPFEQFDLRLNRPDIILKRLGYATDEYIDTCYKAYLLRMKMMNLDTNSFRDDFRVPEMELLTEFPIDTSASTIPFKVHATAVDDTSKIERLNVYVNNVPIYGMKGKDIKDLNIIDGEIEGEIELVPGENEITISVLDSRYVESLRETQYINCTMLEKKPNLHLVTIGVNDYPYLNHLEFAEKDCQTITSLMKLQSDENMMYDRIFVDSLSGNNATKQNIMELKKKLLESHPNDYVVLFLSGHGTVYNDEFYYMTYDCSVDSIPTKGLSFPDIVWLIDSIPARKKLVMIDACQSGEAYDSEYLAELGGSKGEEFVECLKLHGNKSDQKGVIYRNITKEVQNKDGQEKFPDRYEKCDSLLKDFNPFGIIDKYEELFVDLSGASGAVVITASRGNEYAQEDKELKNGAFTHFAKLGLESFGADIDGNNEITALELLSYIKENIRNSPFKSQTPSAKRTRTELDFPIFKKLEISK
jgi:hypothetical protein